MARRPRGQADCEPQPRSGIRPGADDPTREAALLSASPQATRSEENPALGESCAIRYTSRVLDFCRLLPLGFLALTALCATAATPARFTGEQSCASSSCHGGGKDKDQFQIFQKKDIHNHAHQVLANNRSTRIGESL